MSTRTHKKPVPVRRRNHQTNNQNLDQQREMQRNQALIQLVQSWADEDALEDPEKLRAEWEEFKQGLDAARPDDQKLFP